MSADSLLGSLLEFVKTIEEMNHVVLVPSRLVDEPTNAIKTSVEIKEENTEGVVGLHDVYEKLVSVKEKIVSGRGRKLRSSTFNSRADELQQTVDEMTQTAKHLMEYYCKICHDDSGLPPVLNDPWSSVNTWTLSRKA